MVSITSSVSGCTATTSLVGEYYTSYVGEGHNTKTKGYRLTINWPQCTRDRTASQGYVGKRPIEIKYTKRITRVYQGQTTVVDSSLTRSLPITTGIACSSSTIASAMTAELSRTTEEGVEVYSWANTNDLELFEDTITSTDSEGNTSVTTTEIIAAHLYVREVKRLPDAILCDADGVILTRETSTTILHGGFVTYADR